MKNTLLIDADVLCYQMAYSNTTEVDWGDGNVSEALNPERAKAQIVGMIHELREKLSGDDVLIILSDRGGNYRKQLHPEYKAKRKPKPTLWETTRSFLESGYCGDVVAYPSLEGDDVLGILATDGSVKNPVIVSIDKDMQTVPCRLFLFHKPELGMRVISPDDATRFHLFQTLTGDPTDEYKGCPGIGPKTAELILGDTTDWPEAWQWIVAEYAMKKLTEEDAITQARLAFILRAGYYDKATKEVQLWNPSDLRSS